MHRRSLRSRRAGHGGSGGFCGAWSLAQSGRRASRLKRDTLILFTADHSFDLRLPRGSKHGLQEGDIQVGGSHTGEEVPVAAQGPGAKRVRGFFANTYLFDVMLAAYGWKK